MEEKTIIIIPFWIIVLFSFAGILLTFIGIPWFKKRKLGLIMMTVIWIIILIQSIAVVIAPIHYESVKVETHEIYSVTAPFGYIQMKGEYVGTLLMSSGYIEGSEYIYVKYMDGEYLRSESYESDKIDIIVDGTFSYNIVYKRSYVDWLWIFRTYGGTYEFPEIHIPILPEPDMNMTTWYLSP